MEKYTTKQGDTWDTIALKVYNSEKRMDLLMQSNFNLLEYVVFPAGITVDIPEILEAKSDLPIWRIQ